ncbi:hypothetical protein PHLGIDRAFT_276920 [Phlebiopsis gigantea 11061_1 CR5-6]|uniref:SWI5-dependent HO expression protein 3 n=1 Tax=Phlebiopsis gigantea (strain 11061_1 CR5-6) TaxID=745531 RepID=A0A0C3NE14_PHLG1|nr:hypothetical protein PHLGIDRAFT_276920 [Phlebiopsis gigantea 11061_1 CR5-6]
MSAQGPLSKLRDCFGRSRREKAQLQAQIAHLVGEGEVLARQNQSLTHERDHLEQSSRQLAREKEQLEREGRLVARANEELEERCRATALEQEELTRRVETWRVAHAELAETHDGVRRENEVRARLHTAAQAQARQLAGRARSLQDEFGDREAALRLQLAQAYAARTYLSTADSVSHDELLEMVGMLNACIFQLAALVEDVVEIQAADGVSADEVQRSLESLGRWLEPAMLDQLLRLRSDDEFWVETALQAVMT